MEAKSIWHLKAETAILSEAIKPQSKGELLIKAHYSFVSRGTESLIAKGGVSNKFMDSMAVNYMGGDFERPIKYGYSVVGEVVDGPKSSMGKFVHVMHPHQNLFYVNIEDVFFLPDGASLPKMSFLSNMETVVNAYWDADPKPHDKILVLGAGNIGVLLTYTLRNLWGLDVDLVDIDPTCKDIFPSLNIQEVPPRPGDYKVAFNTTSSEEALNLAIEMVGLEGKIVELSWYGDRSININLGGSFHFMRKQIISSQVGLIPLKLEGNMDYKRRKMYCMALLQKGNFLDLITEIVGFKKAPLLFEYFKKGASKGLFLIKYT